MSTRWVEDVLRELEDIERSLIRLFRNISRDFDTIFEYRREGGEWRPAYYEVHESDDEVKVVVELPGVEKEHIDLYIDGNVLKLKTRGDRKYYARILLPANIEREKAKATFKNGILTITLKKKMEGRKIEIE